MFRLRNTSQLLHFILIFFALSACNGDFESGLSRGQELILPAFRQGESFGKALSFVGDFNGDGQSDLLVGAPRNDRGGSEAGAAYLFLGPLRAAKEAEVLIVGQPGERLGTSLNGLIDLNGDGLSDLVIGAPGAALGKGRAYIYFGRQGSSQFGDPTQTISSLELDLWVEGGAVAGANGTLQVSNLGSDVGAAGDFNQDGLLDLGLSVPQVAGSDGPAAGALFLFFAGQDVFTTNQPGKRATLFQAGLGIQGRAGEMLGTSFGAAGDVNGDSTAGSPYGDDLLIGAPGAKKAYLILGQQGSGLGGVVFKESLPFRELELPSEPESFGMQVAGLGNVDGDAAGLSDLAVAAQDQVFIFPGNVDLGQIGFRYATLLAENTGDGFAEIMAGGLGPASTGGALIVAAPRNNILREKGGAVYLFQGTSFAEQIRNQEVINAATDKSRVFRGENQTLLGEPQLGSGLDFGVDLSGDGAADLLIGVPGTSTVGTLSGAVFLEF